MVCDCVVVGAGPAGVTVSRLLRDAGVEHVVLERANVAQTLLSQRWDSFMLNTPGSMNVLLGDVGPLHYSSLPETIALLRQQAAGLPIRTHTPVTSVRRDGDTFLLATPGEELSARTVIVASGAKNVPRRPEQARHLHLTSLHTAEYRSPATLPAGAVLVIGGGQSGGQIAHDLVSAGREVWLAASQVGRYPAQYRGRALIEWHVDCGFWDQRLEDLPDAHAARNPTPLLGGDGTELGLPLLSGLGVRLLGRLVEVDGSRFGFAGDVSEWVRYGDSTAQGYEQMVDGHIAARGLMAEPAAPDRGRGPADIDGRGSLDVDDEGITAVIWATGFGGDFSYLDPLGLPLAHRYGPPLLDGNGGAVSMPALRFVGVDWQSTRSSAILRGILPDAATAVAAVTAELSIRTPQRMR